MLDDLSPVYICRKCKITRITFTDKRGRYGRLVPMEFHDPRKIHVCQQTESFPCRVCNEQIYLDNKVLSKTSNTRIPLSAIDGKPHQHYTFTKPEKKDAS
jgi:hypothetical protein